MHRTLALAALLPALLALSRASAQTNTESLPGQVRIILVGDSTMAVHSGYGPGFCALVDPANTTCVNMAKGGRSTSSYRAESSWARVMETLKDSGEFQATFVLIQFGHNDQPGKPGRSTDLQTEFPANLRRYVEEVRLAGGRPILVTPLARRIFKQGKLTNDLAPWADAARKVASEEDVRVLELNADSVAAVERMGPVEANSLAMAPPPENIAATAASGDSLPAPKAPSTPPQQTNAAVEPHGAAAPQFDYTHLGPKGADYFGRMVADELIHAVPALAPHFRVDGH
ncbi:MAG: rhamnogalacturonan acetylesterase [Bryobacteraceae bacterium]